jgi:hypothetical protein
MFSLNPILRRHLVVIGLAAFLVGGQLRAVIESEEHWPFSPYSMYADLNEARTYRVIRLIGVTAAPENRELTLDSAWMRKSLSKASRHRQAPIMMRKACGAYVQKFGWTNPLDRTGPKMQALRIYEQIWELRADASNRKDPDKVTLLLEYPNDYGRPATTQSTTQPTTSPDDTDPAMDLPADTEEGGGLEQTR